MILKVKPACFLRGAVDLPSSKSYSIRAFLIASLGGSSRIVNPSDCDDAKMAIAVAKKLGSRVVCLKKNIFQLVSSKTSRITTPINVGESGTVLRLILPLLALRGQKVKVDGYGTLRGRPNTFLIRVLRRMGVQIKGHGSKDSIPIVLKGGRLRGGRVSIDGSLSSQFISALLTACPNLPEDTSLKITGRKIVSQTYITMTRQILRQAGIRIIQKDMRHFFIKGRQSFCGLRTFRVPSDYGLAAFFLAAAALVDSRITLKGFLTKDFIQSDGQILKFLRAMGVRFRLTERSIDIQGSFPLKGGEFSLKDSPDLVPIMSILALFAKGRTRIYDIGHARAKESDRISDLRKELLKIGANISESQNEIVIYPQGQYKMNQHLDPHRDHRLAMSFAVLGLKVGCTVKDIECVSKSYPNFVQDFVKIGANVMKYRKIV